MNPNDGKEFLKELISIDLELKNSNSEMNITPMLWGGFGVGKTSIVNQVGKELGFDKVIVIKMNTLTPVDVRGVPYPDVENNVSRFLPPEFIPKDQNLKYLIFFDEINTAPPLSQTAAYEIALERCFGGHKLPKYTCVVMAGNREKDQGSTFDMPMPLANRMVHMEISSDAESFINHHLEINKLIHSAIVAFLKFKPEYLHNETMGDTPIDEIPAVPSSRMWEMVSICLDTFMNSRIGREKISGFVGKKIASEFYEFLNYGNQLPKDLQYVLENNEQHNYKELQLEYYYIISLFYKFRSLYKKNAVSKEDNDYNSRIIATYINNILKSGEHNEIKAFGFTLLKKDKENGSSYLQTMIKYDLKDIFKDIIGYIKFDQKYDEAAV